MAGSAGEPPNRPQDGIAVRLDELLAQFDRAAALDPLMRLALVRVALDAAMTVEALTWRAIDEEWVRGLLADLRALLPEEE